MPEPCSYGIHYVPYLVAEEVAAEAYLVVAYLQAQAWERPLAVAPQRVVLPGEFPKAIQKHIIVTSFY